LAPTQGIDPATVDDVVSLVVPADGGYLGVLRTATAGLAARLQYSLERIEDLRGPDRHALTTKRLAERDQSRS